jgi:hypothetical protein
MTGKICQKGYAAYAINIDAHWFDVTFTGPGETHEIIGANKSYRSGINGVIFRTVTMKTTEGKYRVVVYCGEGVKYRQDSLELERYHRTAPQRSQLQEELVQTCKVETVPQSPERIHRPG